MGQAKRRGTTEERRELAIAWDEAHREDRERFPPPPQISRTGKSWLPILAAIAAQSRGVHIIRR